jgi:hypothetical protein
MRFALPFRHSSEITAPTDGLRLLAPNANLALRRPETRALGWLPQGRRWAGSAEAALLHPLRGWIRGPRPAPPPQRSSWSMIVPQAVLPHDGRPRAAKEKRKGWRRWWWGRCGGRWMRAHTWCWAVSPWCVRVVGGGGLRHRLLHGDRALGIQIWSETLDNWSSHEVLLWTLQWYNWSTK